MATLFGGSPVFAPTSAATGLKLTPEMPESVLGPRTKWQMLNSPSNPSGATYTQDELAALARVLLKHPGVWILTDDIYEHLVYDGTRFATIAAVEPALRERTLTVNGVSKAYAMTGWRIGFGAGPRSLIAAIEKVQGQTTSGACTIAQHAAVAALEGPQDFVEDCRRTFEIRRNLVVGRLDGLPACRAGRRKAPSTPFHPAMAARSCSPRADRRSGTTRTSRCACSTRSVWPSCLNRRSGCRGTSGYPMLPPPNSSTLHRTALSASAPDCALRRSSLLLGRDCRRAGPAPRWRTTLPQAQPGAARSSLSTCMAAWTSALDDSVR